MIRLNVRIINSQNILKGLVKVVKFLAVLVEQIKSVADTALGYELESRARQAV